MNNFPRGQGVSPTNGPANSMTNAFEAQIFAAHMPTQTVAFIVPKGAVISGGIYRIEPVRAATPEDEATFPTPPEGRCPLCGQIEDF